VTVLFLFVLLNRMNIYGAGKNNGEFDAALALLILVFIMFGLFILSNLELTFQNIVLKKVIQNIKKTFLLKNIGCCICIVATTMMGMILKARTTNGLCPANTSIWGSQKCNPLAGCHSIPQGQIMLVYITPIICQLCLKGLSMRGILLSWMIGTAFVITCVLAVGGNDIWSIFYSVLFLFTAFENERYSRILFFESKKAEAAEGERQTLLFERNEAMLDVERRKFELAIISLRNNEKQSLMEKERVQLTSLIGNVAHDLKTPLQSFRMDLELLKTHIKKDNLSSRDVIFLNDDDNPRVILNSLNAACDFMTMAINRSLDFAKASGNITLVPSMETFNIATALSGPVNVIKHVQQDIKICVNPLPLKMCLTLISDKHWFSENVLCLLSNAAKYSDHGEVTVSIELLVNPASVLTDESSHGSIPRTYSNDVYDANCPRLVRVSIEDNGIGLSEEARKNLFQPFKQAQRMAGGTGLGLFSLSKRMEALGGFCGVEPRTDGKRGSNFCFAFPYRPDRSGATTEKTDGVRHSNSNVHSKTGGSEDDPKNSGEISTDDVYNILLVDDSPTIIKVTSRCLRAKGHSVTSASNGSSGLDRLIEGYATKDFHVVLMDLQMPVMVNFILNFYEYYELNMRLLFTNITYLKSTLLILYCFFH
jgi:signal transduction histidine kinase